MTYLSLIALPFYSAANCYILLVGNKSRNKLLRRSQPVNTLMTIVSHHKMKNVRRTFDALVEMFGNYPSNSMLLKDYSLAQLIDAIQEAVNGRTITVDKLSSTPSKLYSEEFLRLFSHVDADQLDYIEEEVTTDEEDVVQFNDYESSESESEEEEIESEEENDGIVVQEPNLIDFEDLMI